MEEIKKFIGPGTAGIAQRIPAYEEKPLQNLMDKLYIVKPNNVMKCSQNQY